MIEESELTWFLTQGISVFERSTFGAVLERLDMDAHVSRTCPICEAGIVIEVTQKRHAKRLKWVAEAKIGDWCRRCNGTGVIPVRLSPEEQTMVDSDGWSMDSDHEGQRSAVPDAVLVRYAFVSRSLSRMPLRLKDALTLAYGDEGAELANTLHGRSWACSPLTKAGVQLLAAERERRTRVNGIEPERPIQAMTALANLALGKGNPERTKLLAEAARDANELLKKAEHCWECVVTLEPKRRAI